MEPIQARDLPAASRRIRGLLGERGVSASELARHLGCSQPYLARRLDGRVEWRVDDLRRIATLLDVPATELFELAAQS